jgi:hypothetical protein
MPDLTLFLYVLSPVLNNNKINIGKKTNFEVRVVLPNDDLGSAPSDDCFYRTFSYNGNWTVFAHLASLKKNNKSLQISVDVVNGRINYYN